MEFRPPSYYVIGKNNKPKSKWIAKIEPRDDIQFALYSTGSRGSGTTYHLHVIDEWVYIKGEEGDFDLKGKNAFGSNILDFLTDNLGLVAEVR